VVRAALNQQKWTHIAFQMSMQQAQTAVIYFESMESVFQVPSVPFRAGCDYNDFLRWDGRVVLQGAAGASTVAPSIIVMKIF
jgi:hypothetical protein